MPAWNAKYVATKSAITGVLNAASINDACPLYGPSPERKAVCRSEGEAGCSHIFGLFKELHFTLRALMEIRAPSPGQLSGLEGPGTGQVRKAPVRPVTHHRQNDLRNHGETYSSLKCA
jgi:hypothetical protein